MWLLCIVSKVVFICLVLLFASWKLRSDGNAKMRTRIAVRSNANGRILTHTFDAPPKRGVYPIQVIEPQRLVV